MSEQHGIYKVHSTEDKFIDHLNKWVDKVKELNLPANIKYGTWLKENGPKEFNSLYQAWKDLNRVHN